MLRDDAKRIWEIARQAAREEILKHEEAKMKQISITAVAKHFTEDPPKKTKREKAIKG